LKNNLHFFFKPLLIFYGLAFLFGPLFYFYCKSIIFTDFGLKRKHLVHFLPSIISLSIVVPFFLVLGPEYLDLNKEARNFDSIFSILSWLIFIQAFSYIIAVIIMFYKQTRIYRNPIKPTYKWLVFFMICFALIWVMAIFMEINASKVESWNYVWLLASFFIYITGYMGLKQPQIFTGKADLLSVKSSKKYERSSLTEENAILYLNKLQQLMDKDKPYLQADLTLPKLAENMSIPYHHLSQIINENLGKNFFEFVNGYRVKAAMSEMNNPTKKHLNIAAIGMEVGFNSISSFNAAFKKYSGMTPSQFLESNKGDRK